MSEHTPPKTPEQFAQEMLQYVGNEPKKTVEEMLQEMRSYIQNEDRHSLELIAAYIDTFSTFPDNVYPPGLLEGVLDILDNDSLLQSDMLLDVLYSIVRNIEYYSPEQRDELRDTLIRIQPKAEDGASCILIRETLEKF